MTMTMMERTYKGADEMASREFKTINKRHVQQIVCDYCRQYLRPVIDGWEDLENIAVELEFTEIGGIYKLEVTAEKIS